MDVLYALGECHYSLGEYEIARNFSEELLRQNPDSSQVRISCLSYSSLDSCRHELFKLPSFKSNGKKEKTEETLTWIAVGVGIAAIAGVALAKSMKR